MKTKKKKTADIYLRYDKEKTEMKMTVKKEGTKCEFILDMNEAWKLGRKLQDTLFKGTRATDDNWKKLSKVIKADALKSELENFVEEHVN